jgi:hypothetical protein
MYRSIAIEFPEIVNISSENLCAPSRKVLENSAVVAVPNSICIHTIFSDLTAHHQNTISMAMPPSTANWHWKTKHVSPWAKEWFTSELAGVSTKDENDTITVERVTEVEGDVEIGQRKSKYAWIRCIMQVTKDHCG